MRPLEEESFEEGTQAGFLADDGYRYITIEGEVFREDKLAWLMIHGVYPECEVLHINGNKADNRLANLKLQAN